MVAMRLWVRDHNGDWRCVCLNADAADALATSEGLVEIAQNRPVEVRVIPDLLWGEVDYEHHYLRVRDEIAPLCGV